MHCQCCILSCKGREFMVLKLLYPNRWNNPYKYYFIVTYIIVCRKNCLKDSLPSWVSLRRFIFVSDRALVFYTSLSMYILRKILVQQKTFLSHESHVTSDCAINFTRPTTNCWPVLTGLLPHSSLTLVKWAARVPSNWRVTAGKHVLR